MEQEHQSQAPLGLKLTIYRAETQRSITTWADTPAIK